MRKYLKVTLFGGLLLVGSSCADFLDINDNPNAPAVVPVTQLLPAIEERMANALGFNGLSLTASYLLTQNVTRGNLNDYDVQPANIQASWNSLYQDCLTDLREMEKIATEKEYHNYVGVSKILKAYIFSILVDLWGDVPFSQAVQGSANSEPTYDSGAEIYAGIFALLDSGIEDLNQPVIFPLTKTAQGGDLIYGSKPATSGTIESYWRRFAKTLKLKLYNQTRLVDDVADEVNAILADGEIMTSQDHDFELPYGTSSNPDDRHPAYPGQYSTGSKTPPNPYFYEVMAGLNTFGHGGNIYGGTPFTTADPRVPYYFYRQLAVGANAQNHPCSYMNGGHCMIYSFSFNLDPREGFDQAASSTVMGVYPIGGRFDDGTAAKAVNNGVAKTPQRMLTHFATLYILAELELTEAGVVVPATYRGTSLTLFEAAVRASFAKVNQVAAANSVTQITAANINSFVTAITGVYTANAGDPDELLRLIMTQKWIASYGFAIDAFTDWRRTGYPLLHDGNTDSPPAPPTQTQPSVTVRVRDYIVSFPYPATELTLNSNAPAQRNTYLDKVFWDN